MVAVVVLVTAVVVVVKVALVAFAAMVTLLGTVAPVVLCSDTVRPLAGAGPVRVTVPVDGLPPTTEVGFMLTEDSAGGLTVRVA